MVTLLLPIMAIVTAIVWLMQLYIIKVAVVVEDLRQNYISFERFTEDKMRFLYTKQERAGRQRSYYNKRQCSVCEIVNWTLILEMDL